MEKPSKSTDIRPIVMISAVSSWLIHTNLLAENQENPPRGSRGGGGSPPKNLNM